MVREWVRRLCIGLFAMVAGIVLLQDCAGTQARLSDRGLSPKDRREYISQNGFGLPKEVQQAFIEGHLKEGMSRDMVLQLFGPADRTAGQDSLWEYVNRRGEDVAGVRFKKDTVIQVYGDPFGRTGAHNSSMQSPVP